MLVTGAATLSRGSSISQALKGMKHLLMERLHIITNSRRDVLELCLQPMEGAHDQTKRLISSGKNVSDKKPPPGAVIPRDLLGRLALIVDAF